MFYAVFDNSNGHISSISNVLPEDLNYIEISKEQYIQFIRNELDYGNFLVVPDPKTKGEFQLVEKNNSKKDFDVSKSIHEFEKNTELENEDDVMYIIQDEKQNKWFAKAKLNENYIAFLNQTKNFSENVKKIYVTEENNPNILIDVLDVELKQFLTEKEFYIKDISGYGNVSLYSPITHESFKHTIRN